MSLPLVGAAFLLVLSGVAFAQAAGTYQCYVSTKDAGVQTVVVQAATEDAAKVAAVQHFGSRSFGLAGVTCASQSQAAPAAAEPPGGKSDARVVLESNPGLRKIPDFPPVAFYPNTDQTSDGVTRGLQVHDCPPYVLKAASLGPGRKCLEVQFRAAAHAYEAGYNTTRTFECILFQNTPKVSHVYEVQIKGRGEHMKAAAGGIRPVAQFDAAGNMISGAGTVIYPDITSEEFQRQQAVQNAPLGQPPSQPTAALQLEDCTKFKAFLEKVACDMRNNNKKAAAGSK